jgi:hypothetical protein
LKGGLISTVPTNGDGPSASAVLRIETTIRLIFPTSGSWLKMIFPVTTGLVFLIAFMVTLKVVAGLTFFSQGRR